MRNHLTVALLLLAFASFLSGCGKGKDASPDARLGAEVTRLGLPEVVARTKEQIANQPTAANYDYLARALALGRQSKPAREAIEKAISLDPTYEPSATLLAQTLMQEGKTSAAEQMMRAVLQKNPRSSHAAEILCRALLKEGKASEALTVVEEALKHDRKSPQLLWARADTQAILKQFEAADKDYRQALQLDPKNVAMRMSYVQTLMTSGKRDEGAKTALETISLAPNSADVRFMAGSALHQAGQLDEALKQYKEALVISPAMVPAANNLALLLADRQQDTGTSVAWARKAAALAPRSLAVADTLGWALARDGQYGDATNILRAVNKAWGTNPSVWYHLGWTLAKSGKKAEGQQLLQRAAGSSSDAAADAQKALKELG